MSVTFRQLVARQALTSQPGQRRSFYGNEVSYSLYWGSARIGTPQGTQEAKGILMYRNDPTGERANPKVLSWEQALSLIQGADKDAQSGLPAYQQAQSTSQSNGRFTTSDVVLFRSNGVGYAVDGKVFQAIVFQQTERPLMIRPDFGSDYNSGPVFPDALPE